MFLVEIEEQLLEPCFSICPSSLINMLLHCQFFVKMLCLCTGALSCGLDFCKHLFDGK